MVYIGAYELSSEIHPTKSFSTEKVKVGNNIIRIDSIELDLLGNASEHSGVEYAHRDHLGSIEAVTNDVGAVMDYMAYEPFGARKSKHWTQNLGSAESTSLLLRTLAHDRKVRGFTDHQHLDRTGFIHMKGRVYDPILGRFLSPDPIVQAPTNSQSWNRYSYVFNSPLVYTDPSGYCAATGHAPLPGQKESITTCYKSPSPAQQDFNDFLSGQEDDWMRWEQERNATYGYNVPPIQIQLPEFPKGDPYKEGGSCGTQEETLYEYMEGYLEDQGFNKWYEGNHPLEHQLWKGYASQIKTGSWKWDDKRLYQAVDRFDPWAREQAANLSKQVLKDFTGAFYESQSLGIISGGVRRLGALGAGISTTWDVFSVGNTSLESMSVMKIMNATTTLMTEGPCVMSTRPLE